jgi:hypothetical protein
MAMSWNPNADNEVDAVSISGSTVYAGGFFTNIGGAARNRIAALDVATGTATAWDPNADRAVLSLGITGSAVYLGGQFSTVAGQSRDGLVAVTPGLGGPMVNLAPSSLAFGNQNVSTTSAPQTVTLTNTGTATLNIASITASGDFARTTGCGSTLAAGANCPTNVTFTPTVVGARTGAITVTSDAPGSPHAVSLSGLGVGPVAFFTLTPCRVADTRGPSGPLGGPALAANTDRTFPLTGTCGIPSSAVAVSINITVTQPSALGDLRLYPGGAPLPLVSSMNYRAGQTRANNVTIPLGSGGTLAVRCVQGSGTAHFIVDVNGYYQ